MEGRGGEYSLYLLSNPPAPFPQQPDGGGWAAGAGIWTDNLLEELLDLSRLLDNDDSLGTKQLDVDPSGASHVQADADPSRVGYLQPAAGMSQGGDAWQPMDLAPPDATIQVGFDSLEPPAADMLTTTELDNEIEVAEMVRVAAQCGGDDERTLWSEEEHKELLARLDLYSDEDAVARCFKIAFHLPKKTALDVALRCRWLQVTGTKAAKISTNKLYPLSKEALNSKSNKELIDDNNMFLKRIEDNLKTGQLANIPDYFYYVKTNMDAIEERGSEFGISMAMPPIDEQGLEEILRCRVDSLALIEDA